jgi:hypothetical protein
MGDPTNPPTRPKPMPESAPAEFTWDDLQAARAEVSATLKLVESDRAKQHASGVRRARAERKAREEARAEGLEFDADELPPLYTGDAALHKHFHGLHYQVARIEKALGINQEPPPRR